ncbi:MAG TPA: creatininase family protein, partial [Sphingomonas sp.]|nr:creatininase family protein [Sphingomonas sp.]
IDIRPEVMVELMLDVFRSLSRAGLRDVYCVTGHFDAAHGKAVADAVERANAERIIRAHFVVPDPLGQRLGLKPSDAILFADWPAGPSARFADLHAGEGETSALLDVDPRLVRQRLAKTLPPTALTPDAVARWRRGGEEARALTPDGYLGDPARASQAAGRKQLAATAQAYADQILRSVGQKH